MPEESPKFSTKIYEAWHRKQLQKYKDVFPRIKKYLKKDMTVIDIGIGPGWLEEFLKDKGFKFEKIVGVDTDAEITEPRKQYIKYHITDHFSTKEKFDFLICFDTLHLIKKPVELLNMLKPGGFALFSLPLRFKRLFDLFVDQEIVEAGKIGKDEIDYFILIKA